MIQAALLSLLLDEASVRGVHAALNARQTTCAAIVRHYLGRIDAYDDRGPTLTAIITVHPRALETAAQMDRLDAPARASRPLHCIPVILKDNFHMAGLGLAAPVKSLAEFVARGKGHASMRQGLAADLDVVDGPAPPEYQRMVTRRNELRQAVMTVMAANHLDAILYPHQKRLVVPIGEDQAERNGVLSNSTGFPALTFPGGFSTPTATAPIGVPVGLELLGPEWSEPMLFRLAYAFEQGTRMRRPPVSTPALKQRP